MKAVVDTCAAVAQAKRVRCWPCGPRSLWARGRYSRPACFRCIGVWSTLGESNWWPGIRSSPRFGHAFRPVRQYLAAGLVAAWGGHPNSSRSRRQEWGFSLTAVRQARRVRPKAASRGAVGKPRPPRIKTSITHWLRCRHAKRRACGPAAAFQPLGILSSAPAQSPGFAAHDACRDAGLIPRPRRFGIGLTKLGELLRNTSNRLAS